MEEPNHDVDSLSHVDPELDPAAGISKWLFRGKVSSPASDIGRGCSCGRSPGCSTRWSQGVNLLGNHKASSTVVCLACQSCDCFLVTRGALEQLLAPCFVAKHMWWAGQPQQLGLCNHSFVVHHDACAWPAASLWHSCYVRPLLSSHPALQVEASDSRKHLTGSAVDSANIDLEAGMATIQARAEDNIKAGAGKKGAGREAEALSGPWSARPDSQVGLPAYGCSQHTPHDQRVRPGPLAAPLGSAC